MPVTTKSAEARKFFNQGVSQIHSFWFMEVGALVPAGSGAGSRSCDGVLGHLGQRRGRLPSSLSVAARSVRRRSRRARAIGRHRRRSRAPPTARQSIRASARGKRSRRRCRCATRCRHASGSTSKRKRRAGTPRRRRRTRTTSPALRKLVAAYPDDLEAKSILGLALLDGYDSVTKAPRTNTVEGVTLLHEVTAKNDNALRRAPLPDSRVGRQHHSREGVARRVSAIQNWCRTFRTRCTCPATSTRRAIESTMRSTSFAEAASNELKWIGADVLYPERPSRPQRALPASTR